MSRKATEFQKKEMSRMYRGKEIFKPLNTGWIDEHVACVREWVANIFFYRKGDTTIMIDAVYNYDRLEEKMGWLGIDPKSIRHILITHQDTDHVGAVEVDSPGLFRDATLYVGEIEDRYLTGEVRRRVIYHLYKLPQVTINDQKVLLKDGQVFDIDGHPHRVFPGARPYLGPHGVSHRQQIPPCRWSTPTSTEGNSPRSPRAAARPWPPCCIWPSRACTGPMGGRRRGSCGAMARPSAPISLRRARP